MNCFNHSSFAPWKRKAWDTDALYFGSRNYCNKKRCYHADEVAPDEGKEQDGYDGDNDGNDSLANYSYNESVNTPETEAYYELKELFASHDWTHNTAFHSRAFRLLQNYPTLITEEYDEFDWNEIAGVPNISCHIFAGVSAKYSSFQLTKETSTCYTPIYEFLKAKNTLRQIQGIVDVFPEILTEYSSIEPLPLHYACLQKEIFDNNEGVIEYLADAYPGAAEIRYGNKLPIHLLLEKNDCPPLETVKIIFDLYPDALFLPIVCYESTKKYDNLLHFAFSKKLINPYVLEYLIEKISLGPCSAESNTLCLLANFDLMKSVTSYLGPKERLALMLSGTLTGLNDVTICLAEDLLKTSNASNKLRKCLKSFLG